MTEQSMLEGISKTMGRMGVSAIQIGSQTIDIPVPKSLKSLRGMGDTVKLGDRVLVLEDGKVYPNTRTEGVISLIAKAPEIGKGVYDIVVTSDNGNPASFYVGTGYTRTFKLMKTLAMHR